MPVVEIAQHWIDELTELQLEAAAAQIDEMVDAAMKQYMFRQRQEKIAREQRWYEAHYHELAQQYHGQYVAVHKGRLVDADPDGRSRGAYGSNMGVLPLPLSKLPIAGINKRLMTRRPYHHRCCPCNLLVLMQTIGSMFPLPWLIQGPTQQ